MDGKFTQSQFKVPNSVKSTTDNSSNHNGGHDYYQMKNFNGFSIIPGIQGHTQKQNITVPTNLRGFLGK
jgi:hypothetical protein